MLPYVTQRARASSMHEGGHPKSVLWDNIEGKGGKGLGWGVQDEGDPCISMADSY